MGTDRTDFLAQIAVWYYEEGLDQEAIAQRIQRSRSLVSRLLDEARQAGLVEVRVRYPLRTDAELESKLRQQFGLQQAFVLADPPADQATLLRRLGELGARYLQQCLHPGSLIGVGWGTAVHAVVRAMPTWTVPGATVVQIIGAVGYGDPMVDGAELARWLSEKLGAAYRYLSAPLIVEDELVAQALLRERAIAETLALARKVEVTVMGVGTTNAQLSSLRRAGYMTSADLADLEHLGAVGDLLARQMDQDGRILDIPANRRVIGLDENDLRSIPIVIAVAGGLTKAKALLATVRGQHIKVLVTDANAAAEVLRLGNTAERVQNSQFTA